MSKTRRRVADCDGNETDYSKMAASQHSDTSSSGDSLINDTHKLDLSMPVLPSDNGVKTTMSGNTGLKGDRGSIALLMLLYVLQGIPLGIASSIPYLLQSRHVSYKDQAMFSFVHWPFSIKLLWAPIVDSVYFPVFGRRKSWLVPTQYLIALFMYVLSATQSIKELDNVTADSNISILLLTTMFFLLNFLAATQDIAVDGWALTMLSKRNVGWVATCNTVGQTAGYFVGNVVFLTLESAEFCNKYLRAEPSDSGLVNLSSFLRMWSLMFLVVTTLVMIFKHEREERSSVKGVDGQFVESESVLNTYLQLWRVVRLPSIVSLIVTLLTMKVGFAAADSVTSLKLIEEGVPKEHLALLAIPMVPVDIILPVLITRFTSQHRPLDVLLSAMPFRLLLGILFAAIVYLTPAMRLSTGDYPMYYYVVLLLSSAIHQVTVYCMFVPLMAFFAKVSDPAIGGTYMTLLNTVSNLGGNWPATGALWLIETLTLTGCTDVDGNCVSSSTVEVCGKVCTLVDGYYVESVVCLCVGVLWLWLRAGKVRRLQDLPARLWSCTTHINSSSSS